MQGALFTQLAACVAMLGVSIAVSEAGAQFQEPAQSDVYYYFDAVTGSISPLEMQITKVMTKNYLFVVDGGYELAGGRSSFRIKSGQKQEFLIRLSPAFEGIREHGFTLKDYVFLTAASARKDRRKIVTVRWPLAGRPSINENKIPCKRHFSPSESILQARIRTRSATFFPIARQHAVNIAVQVLAAHQLGLP